MITRKSQKVVVVRDCRSARSAEPACQIVFSRDTSGRSAVTGGLVLEDSDSANKQRWVNRRTCRELKTPGEVMAALQGEARRLELELDWQKILPLVSSIDWITAAVIAKNMDVDLPRLPTADELLTQRALRSVSRVSIQVEWGYDLHEVEVTFERWVRILNGEPFQINNKYFYEGDRFTAFWYFDRRWDWELKVDYCDDSGDEGEGWIGTFSDIDLINGPIIDNVDLAVIALEASDEAPEESGYESKEATSYPPWVVLHVPHDSTDVPSSVRAQFLLDDGQLAAELNRMTDRHTLALFAEPEFAARVVRTPVSRLVVDVERFVDDDYEPMASRGMGCVYTVTSGLKPLRRLLTVKERESLVRTYYLPHHARLEAAVAANKQRYGCCLVIDCHSFPNRALPYEQASSDEPRVDICIGTDEFHTSSKIETAFVAEFERAGFSVAVNDPFAGALVPISQYQIDRRVSAIMVEVNRRLYMNEASGERLPTFDSIAQKIRGCCIAALVACGPRHSWHR